MEVLIGTCPLPLRSVGNRLLPPTQARIWGLQADPQTLAEPTAQLKRPARLPPAQLSEDLPLWAEGYQKIVILSSFRYAALQQNANPLPLITRFARLSRCRGLLAVKVHWTFTNRSRGLETFVFFLLKCCGFRDFSFGENLYILMQHLLPQKPKDSSKSMPLNPQREAWSPLLPSSVKEPHHSNPARFQLRWHLRLRLGNVSKLPFLSACT